MAWVTLALFIVSLGFGIVGPFVPDLAARAGENDVSMFSVVYLAAAAAKLAVQPVAGVWVDRQGPKRVLFVALAIYAVAMGLLAWPTRLWGLAAVRALEGTGEGMVYPAVLATVRGESQDHEIGKRLGVALAIGSSGLLLGPVLGALLRDFGLFWPMLLVAVLSAVLSVLIVTRMRSGHAPQRAVTLEKELANLWAVLRTRDIVIPALPVAFNKLVFSGFLALFPVYVVAGLAAPKKYVAIVFLVVGISFAAAQPFAGWLVDRFAPAKVVAACAIPLFLSTAALGYPKDFVRFSILLGGEVLLQSVIFSGAIKQLVVAQGARDAFGGVMGSIATVTDAMTLIGPVVVLFAYARWSSLCFVLMAGLGILFYAPYAQYVFTARRALAPRYEGR